MVEDPSEDRAVSWEEGSPLPRGRWPEDRASIPFNSADLAEGPCATCPGMVINIHILGTPHLHMGLIIPISQMQDSVMGQSRDLNFLSTCSLWMFGICKVEWISLRLVWLNQGAAGKINPGRLPGGDRDRKERARLSRLWFSGIALGLRLNFLICKMVSQWATPPRSKGRYVSSGKQYTEVPGTVYALVCAH